MNKRLIVISITIGMMNSNANSVENTPGETEILAEGVDMYQDRPAAFTATESNVELNGEPCVASKRDYSAFFDDLYEPGPSLLNECALGSLINFNVLMGFDPFGKILSAIKGAACGFVRDQIHDPFVSTINDKISQANAWTRATNNGYSNWINEESRNLQTSLYDPTSRFDKPESFVPKLTQDEIDEHRDQSNNENGDGDGVIDGVIPPVQYTPVETPTTDDVLNSGGSTTIKLNNGDTILLNNDSSWTEIYNVYQ